MITKNIKTLITACLLCCNIIAALTACSDMLEMDSDRQVFDPSLDEKTDSVYYILGTLQGLQQAADQYVLVGELRGDLLVPTQYADSALTQLYNYTARATNKYDSAYVFYRVINNCNYYVAHRDTTLRTGSRQVALGEYAQALAIRAWSYMQLAKTYGRVPFYTEPLDNISQGDDITADTSNYRDQQGICEALAPELLKFVGTPVPNYGTIDASSGKTVNSQRIMLPVDLVLADLYLETGRYADAAQLYYGYLRRQAISASNRPVSYTFRLNGDAAYTIDDLPGDLTAVGTRYSSDEYGAYSWTASYNVNPTALTSGGDVISYIPLAVNKLQGTISTLPGLFGYNQFANINSNEEAFIENYQLDYSDEYKRLASMQPFYYVTREDVALADTLGDMRRWASLSDPIDRQVGNSQFSVFTKFNGANVLIYRASVVYLRLAECINRMGYPDAAFAILKDGLGNTAWQVANYPKYNYVYAVNDSTGLTLLDDDGNAVVADSIRNTAAYISSESYSMLTTTLPFLTQATRNVLGRSTGIHSHGCGFTSGATTLYRYSTVVNDKARELKQRYDLALPDSLDADSEEGRKLAVEVVEDLICDEYALEAALEGHRFGDLLRLARNKNRGDGSGRPFGDNWGGRWLNGKLAFKKTGVDFTRDENWYLPLK